MSDDEAELVVRDGILLLHLHTQVLIVVFTVFTEINRKSSELQFFYVLNFLWVFPRVYVHEKDFKQDAGNNSLKFQYVYMRWKAADH